MRIAARLMTALLATLPVVGFAKDLPNVDAFASSPATKVLASTTTNPLIKQGTEVQYEHRLGVPTFLWASKEASSTQQSLARWSVSPEQVARNYLADYASLYRLSAAEAAQVAVLQSVHNTGKGAVIAKFRQVVNGVDVFRNEINVVMNQDRELVALSGYLSPNGASNGLAADFDLSAQDAVAAAFEELAGSSVSSEMFLATGQAKAGYTWFALPRSLPEDNKATLNQPARAKRVWFDLGNKLEAAYYVELEVAERDSSESDSYAYVVSANDGRTLWRKNLTEYDQFTYRVWADPASPFTPQDDPAGNGNTPHPTGTPNGYQAPFIAPTDVTLRNSPFSQNDPWLAAGATATVGNNVDAYADLFSPDGYGPVAAPAHPATGDFRAQATGPNAFLHTYDTAQAPAASATQRQAAITQLFFVNNFLHDWYYDSGFDEAAGNAQALNFGRGGLEGDSLKAEAQDFGGRNNANMNTPADGSRPRMQMYVFDANARRYLDVNTPAGIAGRKSVGTAAFGPTSFNLTGDVVYAQPANGCTAFTNAGAVAGKIALVDRGTCSFNIKAEQAQAAGAVAVLVANNTTGLITMSGTSTATIPALSILQVDGTAIKAELTAGNVVNVTMFRELGIDRDGTIDNMIVAHEWGHFISNRLVGNAAGLGNIMGRGMGEGWSDFHALLMTVKPEDAAHPANANWTGAFAMSTYVTSGGGNNGYYFGIRRLPYSIDFAKNALTYQHIQNGVPLPVGVPTASGHDGANNAQVHNTGEVWATMLWESYTSLLKDTGRLTFAQARDRMKAYLVAAYKITPPNPTLLEARDAILAVAAANDLTDYDLIGAAFARRGAGIGAIAPDRYSSTHVGVVESYTWGNDLVITGISLSDNTTWCDRDGYLDNGETGKLTVTIRNTGAEPLTRATVNVVSYQSGIIFPNGGQATFPTVNPLQTASVSIDVGLTTSFSPDFAQFLVSVSDPTLEVPRTIQGYNAFYVNTDEVLAATPFDSVDATNMVWTTGRDTTLGNQAPWRREVAYANGYYFGPDPSQGSDQYLISPPLNVSTGTNFGISFQHRFDFEADPVGASPRNFYDGGRVEISNDGGATWTDIGPSLMPGYNGTLVNYAGNVNPLKGQTAFVGQNPSYPGYDFVWADLGSAYAGQTVRVRFRVATDASAGAGGWEVDQISFNGIDNTPFAYLGLNQAQCVNRRPVANAGAAQIVNERSTATLNGTASSDPDSDALTYAWSQTAGPAVALSGADTAQPTFTAPEVTADTALAFTLVVTDTAGNTSLPATTLVTVRNVNRAPIAIAPGGSFDERGTAVLQGSGTDPDGDALTYAWTQTSGPAVTLEGANTARPSFATPEVSANAQFTFDLVVSDGALSSAPATAVVTVRNVNRPPRAHPGATQTVPERTSVSLDGSASVDPDGDGLNYTWIQTAGPAVALTGGTSASPTFTAPEVSRNTLLSFSLVVDDGQAASPAASVAILVTNVNRAPGVTVGADFSADERTVATLSAMGTDPDNDALFYSWVQLSGPPAALSDASSATPSFTVPEVRSSAILIFQVTVTDGEMSSTTSQWVTARNVNRRPVAHAGPATNVNERTVATLRGSGSDIDDDFLSYSWVQVSGPAVTLLGDNTATPSFNVPEVTAHTSLVFQVTVSDGSLSDTSTVDVLVLNVNRAPVANAGQTQEVDERAEATLNGGGSDEDNDTLSFEWVQTAGPQVNLVGANTATPTFTAPEVARNTLLSFSLVVRDGSTASAASSVTVLVVQVNRSPSVIANLDFSADERTEASLAASGTDPDNDALRYSWVQTAGPRVALDNAGSDAPTFTVPEVSADTTLTFVVTVSDGAATSTATVNVLAKHVNRAPVANAGLTQTVEERSSATLRGAGSDIDGDTVSYAWTQASGPEVTLVGADTANPTFTAPEVTANATLVFTLTVSDGTLTHAANVTVHVRNANRSPRANAGAAQEAPERSEVTLIGSGSDEDGDTLSYEWVQTAGPRVTLVGGDSARPTFTAPEVRHNTLLTFSLVVRDGTVASAPSSVTVLVLQVNRAPGLTAGADFAADERTVATLSSSGTDQDGDTLRYSWVQTGGPAVALSDAYAASPTFTTPEVRADTVLTFTVTVSDGADSSTATVRVQVRQVNRLPVMTAGAAQTVQERSLVMLSGAATDSDGDTLTYEWVQTSGPEVVLSDARAARPSFIAPNVNKAGAEIAFTLTVNDGTTSTSSSTQITVTDSNRQPRANAGANQTVVERGTATLSGAGSSDEDGDELRYTWTQVSGTTVALRNAASAAPSFDTPEVSADSKLVFKLVVNDGAVDSAEASVEVLVKNVNRAPRADAGQSQFVNPGATVTLHGNNSSDPDATSVTYAWKQTSGPEVMLSDASAAEPTFQLDKSVKVGTQLSFELTVTDESGASSTSLVSVLVAAASGGCSVAGPESSASALFPVLFLGAALFLARRRRA